MVVLLLSLGELVWYLYIVVLLLSLGALVYDFSVTFFRSTSI